MSPAGPVVPGKLALPRAWYLIKHNINQFRDYMTIGPAWLTAISAYRTGSFPGNHACWASEVNQTSNRTEGNTMSLNSVFYLSVNMAAPRRPAPCNTGIKVSFAIPLSLANRTSPAHVITIIRPYNYVLVT